MWLLSIGNGCQYLRNGMQQLVHLCKKHWKELAVCRVCVWSSFGDLGWPRRAGQQPVGPWPGLATCPRSDNLFCWCAPDQAPISGPSWRGSWGPATAAAFATTIPRQRLLLLRPYVNWPCIIRGHYCGRGGQIPIKLAKNKTRRLHSKSRSFHSTESF